MTGALIVYITQESSGPEQTRIRVLLADDYEDMIKRVKALLEPDFEVVGSVRNGQTLVHAAEELRPDVLVVDISMPLLNGIEAVRRIMSSGCKEKVIFLTVHDDPDMVSLCMEAGGLGFVVKSRLASDLIPAIRLALVSRTFISPTVPWNGRA